jgi:hypothetical protein
MKQSERQGLSPAVFSTSVLAPFLRSVTRGRKPTILDIGPVVGANLQFLVEQRMKVYVDDVLAGWDRWQEERGDEGGTSAQVAAYLETHLTYPPGLFDGVLCWDTLDALEPCAARLLVGHLHGLLKDGGMVLALFGPRTSVTTHRATYLIMDEWHLAYGRTTARRYHAQPYTNHHIAELFSGFHLAQSYLLRNGLREILFRKTCTSARQLVFEGHLSQHQGTPRGVSPASQRFQYDD